jgi:glycosyltransferase involved in cell wall biosynthesis
MVTSSYPRFAGDNVGSFVEPIAKGVAARGYPVHLVAPWHPRIARPPHEDGISYHFFKYAPVPALNVFGYAGAMKADVELRAAAWMAAPLALAAGWHAARRVARRVNATVMHAHWVIPGGAIAALAAGPRGPVVSLHGSDVYVAETSAVAGRVAHAVFARAGWVTACSEDLRRRALALGAPASRSEVVPYGVDSTRFRPDAAARSELRGRLGIAPAAPVVATAGRFVRKKGFEYLVAALPDLLRTHPELVLVLGGDGELDAEYKTLAARLGVDAHVRFPGMLPQDDVSRLFAAADVLAVPSV